MVTLTRIRLYDNARAALLGHDIVTRYKSHSPMVAVVEFNSQATTTAIETLMGTAAGAELDGTTTPELLSFLSTDPKDTYTGAGTQQVEHISVQAVGTSPSDVKIEREVVNMTGTTVALTAKYHVRNWAFHTYQNGSEKDNAAAITMTTAAATYLTLTAASAQSSGNKFWIPEGWAACVYMAEYSALTAPAPTTSVMAKFSARYTDFKEDPYNATGAAGGQILNDTFSVGTYSPSTGSVQLRQIPLKGSTSGGSFIQFYESWVNATSTYNVRFFILLIDLRRRPL